jgi:Tfp pilus assembly protein PilO
MDLMLWNVVLSVGLGLVGWLAKTMWSEVQRLNILLNRTREEVARDYVTKQEVHADINRVIDQLKRLDEKLDRVLERSPKRGE